MGNKDLEKLIRRIVNEAPVDYGDYPERMDPRSQAKIEDPEGLYAKNRSFRKGSSDVERIAGKRFKEIVDYVKRYFGTEDNVTDPSVKRAIQMEQMNSVRQSMSIEPEHREQLRNLAVEIAAKEAGWMGSNVTMEESLEQGLITKRSSDEGGAIYEFDFFNVLTFLGEQKVDASKFQMEKKEKKKLDLPPNFSFDVDELTPDEIRQLEIEKRNVINAIIQGTGKRIQFAYQLYKDRLDEIDPRLYSLYNKIMSANDLMYFTEEQLIEALGGNAAGSSGQAEEDGDDEEGGGEENKEDNDVETFYGNGLIFPILLHELGKTFEMIPSREQWRDVDPSMAQDVMGQTDVFSNEPMQFRVGGELVRKLRTLLPNEITIDEEGRKYKPYFLKIFYGIPAEEFLKDIIANVVSDDNSDNDKARRKFEEILQKAKKEYDRYNNDDDDDDEEDNNDTTGIDFSDIGL
jgi:hypothetical protein